MKQETFEFSEVVELITKELAEKSGEELAEIATTILEKDVEYEGGGVFITKGE